MLEKQDLLLLLQVRRSKFNCHVKDLTLNVYYQSLCSGNACCTFVGLMGTKWGDKYRSQIFFIGFWLSIIGMAALCASIACLSTDSSSIKAVPFFQGSLDIVENGVTSKLYYYAGIARMVIRGCEDGETCPPESIGWGSDACDLYFTNCHKCIFKPRKVSFPIVMSLLGQVGQIGTDLTRSTGAHFTQFSRPRFV